MSSLLRFINRSFSRRISFYFLPLIVSLSIVTATLSYFIYYNAIKQDKEEAANLLVKQIGKNFDFYFEDAKTLVASLCDDNNIQQAFSEYQNMSIQQKFNLDNSIDNDIRNATIFQDYIKDVLILGKNGYQHNLPTYYPLDYKKKIINSIWLQHYINTPEHQIYFTPPHADDYYTAYEGVSLQSQVISAILPVYGQNKQIGYIIGDIDYSNLNGLLDQIYKKNDIDISMITEEGLYVFSRDAKKVNTDINKQIFLQIEGASGEFSGSDTDGRQLYLYEKSEVTGWYLLASIPYMVIMKPSNDVLRTVIFLIMPLSLICAVGFTLLIGRRLRRPLAKLVDRMESVDIEKYEQAQASGETGEIGHLENKFEEMLERINQLVVQTYRLELQQKDAEFIAMRNQITPHFMYNALQLIKTEAVLSSNQEISQIVNSFGNLLRYAIENNPSMVPVQAEVEYISNYLAIYKRRFGNRFQYRINISPEIARMKILKFVLQPVVENCIRHGFQNMKFGGLIEVAGRLESGNVPNTILFTITDNGQGIPEEELAQVMQNMDNPLKTQKSIGLGNVHQRICIKDGPQFGIVSIQSEPGMTVVKMRLVGGDKDDEGIAD